MEKKELRETRKQMMAQMEQKLHRTDKDARKLAAISVVAAGYGGDMDEVEKKYKLPPNELFIKLSSL